MKLVHIGTDAATRQEQYVNMEEFRVLQILPDIQSTPNNPHTNVRMERSTIGRPVTYIDVVVVGKSEDVFRLIQDQLVAYSLVFTDPSEEKEKKKKAGRAS